MKRNFIFVFFILVSVLLLSGCNWPGPAVKCPPADLIEVTVISPTYHEKLTDTTPTLWWSFNAITIQNLDPYPTPPTAYNCSPDSFRISLSTGPLFLDELGADVSDLYNWTTPVLENGKTYRWSVVAISDGVVGPSISEPYNFNYFTIGEDCVELEAPLLLAPADGSTVQTLEPTLFFDNPMACIPGDYWVQYSQDPNFPNSEYIGAGFPMVTGINIWLDLENCATYYWRARAVGGDPYYGPFSETWSFDVRLANTLCQQKIEIPYLIPELIPSPPPDPSDRMWEVIRDAKCRLGPTTAYPETGFLPIGHMAKILGRNEDGTWFRVMDPNGIACWGSIIAFDVPEGWENLDVLRYDPLPTATPTLVPPYNCSQHIDRSSCSAKFPVCNWDPNDSVCKNN